MAGRPRRRTRDRASRFYKRALAGGALLFVLGVGLGLGGGAYFGGAEKQQVVGAPPSTAELSAPGPEETRLSLREVERLHAAALAVTADLTLAHALEAADRLETPTHDRALRRVEPSRVEPPEDLPDWKRYAVRIGAHPIDAPKIAIVIDDLGVNRAAASEAARLPAPMTLSFMTYAPAPQAAAERARQAGHEVMLHVPMQPHSDDVDPGPNVLLTDHGESEMLARLEWGLSRLTGYTGINNHMGSAFTTDEPSMRAMLKVLKARGLLFLDSRTDPDSLGESLAAELGVPHAARDIFLDNERDPAAIRLQLDRTEAIARRTGSAIAIGHPYPETYEVLHDWVNEARARGIVLVPVSALVKHDGKRARDLAKAAE